MRYNIKFIFLIEVPLQEKRPFGDLSVPYIVDCGVVQLGGSSTGLSLVGPTKAKARKSVLLTEGFLKVENKEQLFDYVVALYFTSLYCNALRIRKVPQSL